jgi:hypothetical protein
MYKKDKVRENQNLIHLSENFLTLKSIYKNHENSRKMNKVSPKSNQRCLNRDFLTMSNDDGAINLFL